MSFCEKCLLALAPLSGVTRSAGAKPTLRPLHLLLMHAFAEKEKKKCAQKSIQRNRTDFDLMRERA
jgi:hypothetical protein